MKETADMVMVDEEVDAVAAVRGKPSFIQQVAPSTTRYSMRQAFS